MSARARNSSGQTAVELLGILLVIGAITGALLASGVAPAIANGLKTKVCEIAGGDDCGSDTDEADAPKNPACINGSDSQKYSAKGWISTRWFKVGPTGNREYKIVALPDGTYQVSVRLEAGALVGPGLGSKAPVDGDGKLTGGYTVTFAPQSEADARKLLDDYKEADKKTADYAVRHETQMCISCALNNHPPDYYADIKTPGTASETYDGSASVEIKVGTDTVGKGKSKPKHRKDQPADGQDGAASVKVNGTQMAGVTNVRSGPDAGGRVLFFESTDGFAGDAAIGPIARAALNGKLTGKQRVAVTLDAEGNPTKLTFVTTGEAEGGVTGGVQAKGGSFGEAAGKVKIAPYSDKQTKGKGVELTTEVDLTDPTLRRNAKIALTGVDPDTGERVDRTDAANALGEAARDSTQVGIRHYDIDGRTQTVGADIVVAGGEVSFEDRNQRTTGYDLYDPKAGRWTHYSSCPGSAGGTVTGTGAGGGSGFDPDAGSGDGGGGGGGGSW